MLARLSAAPLAVLGEMVIFQSVLFARSSRQSATGNNLVGLIFARDRLNLKEFTAELAESRRTSTDQMLQRDDWQHGFWAACPRKGERVGSDVARRVSGSALLHA